MCVCSLENAGEGSLLPLLRSVRLTLDLFASGLSDSVVSSCSGVDFQVQFIIPTLSVCLSFILCLLLFNGF